MSFKNTPHERDPILDYPTEECENLKDAKEKMVVDGTSPSFRNTTHSSTESSNKKPLVRKNTRIKLKPILPAKAPLEQKVHGDGDGENTSKPERSEAENTGDKNTETAKSSIQSIKSDQIKLNQLERKLTVKVSTKPSNEKPLLTKKVQKKAKPTASSNTAKAPLEQNLHGNGGDDNTETEHIPKPETTETDQMRGIYQKEGKRVQIQQVPKKKEQAQRMKAVYKVKRTDKKITEWIKMDVQESELTKTDKVSSESAKIIPEQLVPQPEKIEANKIVTQPKKPRPTDVVSQLEMPADKRIISVSRKIRAKKNNTQLEKSEMTGTDNIPPHQEQVENDTLVVKRKQTVIKKIRTQTQTAKTADKIVAKLEETESIQKPSQPEKTETNKPDSQLEKSEAHEMVAQSVRRKKTVPKKKISQTQTEKPEAREMAAQLVKPGTVTMPSRPEKTESNNIDSQSDIATNKLDSQLEKPEVHETKAQPVQQKKTVPKKKVSQAQGEKPEELEAVAQPVQQKKTVPKKKVSQEQAEKHEVHGIVAQPVTAETIKISSQPEKTETTNMDSPPEVMKTNKVKSQPKIIATNKVNSKLEKPETNKMVPKLNKLEVSEKPSHLEKNAAGNLVVRRTKTATKMKVSQAQKEKPEARDIVAQPVKAETIIIPSQPEKTATNNIDSHPEIIATNKLDSQLKKPEVHELVVQSVQQKKTAPKKKVSQAQEEKPKVRDIIAQPVKAETVIISSQPEKTATNNIDSPPEIIRANKTESQPKIIAPKKVFSQLDKPEANKMVRKLDKFEANKTPSLVENIGADVIVVRRTITEANKTFSRADAKKPEARYMVTQLNKTVTNKMDLHPEVRANKLDSQLDKPKTIRMVSQPEMIRANKRTVHPEANEIGSRLEKTESKKMPSEVETVGATEITVQLHQVDQSQGTSDVRKQCWVETASTKEKESVVVEGDREISKTPVEFSVDGVFKDESGDVIRKEEKKVTTEKTEDDVKNELDVKAVPKAINVPHVKNVPEVKTVPRKAPAKFSSDATTKKSGKTNWFKSLWTSLNCFGSRRSKSTQKNNRRRT